MTIYFYSVRDAFGCFSNFSPHGFQSGGKYWRTSEHYFQAKKFHETPFEEVIRLVPSPKEAAVLGRDRSFPLPNNWESVKNTVMRDAVRGKFDAHGDIRNILLGTGEEDIIERAVHDSYWGCGPDGKGRNMLGIILMELRTHYRKSIPI